MGQSRPVQGVIFFIPKTIESVLSPQTTHLESAGPLIAALGICLQVNSNFFTKTRIVLYQKRRGHNQGGLEVESQQQRVQRVQVPPYRPQNENLVPLQGKILKISLANQN